MGDDRLIEVRLDRNYHETEEKLQFIELQMCLKAETSVAHNVRLAITVFLIQLSQKYYILLKSHALSY